MELKINHCKKCGHSTPSKGNILNIKKLRVRTRNDLERILGHNFRAKCHLCKVEEIYDNKDVVAKNHKRYSIYGMVYGLIIGFLYLTVNEFLIESGIYQTRIGKVIDLNDNLMIDAEILLASSLTGLIIGIIFDIIDTWKAKKFNES